MNIVLNAIVFVVLASIASWFLVMGFAPVVPALTFWHYFDVIIAGRFLKAIARNS